MTNGSVKWQQHKSLGIHIYYIIRKLRENIDVFNVRKYPGKSELIE